MKDFLQNNTVNHDALLQLFGQAPLALAVLKGESMILEAANDKMLEYLGVSREVMGLSLVEAQPYFADSKFIDFLLETYKTGKVFDVKEEEFVLDTFGNQRSEFYDFTFSPLKNEKEEIEGVICIATDVTEQIVSRKKIEESELRFKNLIMEMEVPTAFYRGEDLIVEIINEVGKKLWGKPYEVIGLKLEDALPELQNQQLISILKEVYRSGKIFKKEGVKVDFNYNGDMQTFYFNLYYKPIFDAYGKVQGVLSMGLDVTTHLEYQNMLEKSDERLREIISSVPMAMSVLRGSNFKIELSNNGVETLWNKGEDRIGKNILEVYPEIENHKIYDYMKQAYESGRQLSVKEIEFDFPHFDKTRFMNYIFTPIDLHANEKTLISVGYDVTEEMEMRNMILDSVAQFRNLADSIPQIVWTCNANGKTDYFNERWYEYSGFTRNIFGDEAWNAILWPEDLERVNQAWDKSLAIGEDFELEYRFKDKTVPSGYRWFLVRAVPVKNEKGNVVKWIGTSTDINDFKEYQKLKDDFLGIASHELKTPLTSLKLYAQVLERMMKKDGNERAADFASKMEEQVNRLNNLVVDLLDVTKIQNGQMNLKEDALNFDLLAQEVCSFMQMSAEDHKIEFEDGGVGEIISDRDRISQVMVNFISNAVKYSPGQDKVIVKTYKTVDGDIGFSVKDFGIGMTEDKVAKIFDQFYRVREDDKNSFEGLGLGLYISAQIIKKCNGTIKVASAIHKGSNFCFEIPKTQKTL